MPLYRANQSLDIRNANFEAGERLVLEQCTGTIRECKFAGGETRLVGPAIDVKRRSLYTQLDGGAVLVVGLAKLTFKDCTFYENDSVMCGGAVSVQANRGSKIAFEGCTFVENTVP